MYGPDVGWYGISNLSLSFIIINKTIYILGCRGSISEEATLSGGMNWEKPDAGYRKRIQIENIIDETDRKYGIPFRTLTRWLP